MRQALSLFILLVTTFSCCKKPPFFTTPCCFSLRRPQVMVDKKKTEKPDIEPCSYIPLDPREECPIEERDLTCDDFKPYMVPPGDMILQAGDIFDISLVEEETGAVEDVMVAPDGKLYYSVLDGIMAKGRTLREVIEELEDSLKKYYLNPHVTLTPKVLHTYTWWILGRVRKPGSYSLEVPITLRGAFGVAGGLLIEDFSSNTQLKSYDTRSWADLDRSFLIRDGKKLRIDFRRLLYTVDESQNVYIHPHDYILIAPLEKKEIFVLGDVLQPTKLTYTKEMTLMGALAEAHGWDAGTPFSADLTRVLILRGSLQNPKPYLVNVQKVLKGEERNIALCPGDIIYVSDKTLRYVGELVRIAVNAFVYGFCSNAGQFWSEFRWFPSPISSENTTSGGTSP